MNTDLRYFTLPVMSHTAAAKVRTLLKAVFYVTAALIVAGCAGTVETPAAKSVALMTTAKSGFRPAKDATYAFQAEAGARQQKLEFLTRASGHLARHGFQMSDSRTADYLIVVAILGPVKASSTWVAPPSSHSALPPRTEKIEYGIAESTFGFGIIRRTDFEKDQSEPIWTATVMATEKDFRAHEEDLVVSVFSHVGETYSGQVRLENRTTPPPDPPRS